MNIYKFYNSLGWKKNIKTNVYEDAKLFEDLRKNSKEYVSRCRKRILRYIPQKGKNILDFASGPIQYPEYLLYSKNFDKRHCLDFSKDAIKIAKKKINRNKGKFYCGDFFKIKLKKNYFDCIISLHTIYHINKNKQKLAIKQLIRTAKPGSPIIIVYSNPHTLINRMKKFFISKKKKQKIYFYCHNIEWWNQFENLAEISFFPWRSFSAKHQEIIFFDNYLGKICLRMLFKFEDFFKNFFVKNFQYYTIVLKKY